MTERQIFRRILLPIVVGFLILWTLFTLRVLWVLFTCF